MIRGQQHLLIGLPHSGKTTFLAALWYSVQELKLKGALRLEVLKGDSSYLNLISDAWLKCLPVPRTNPDSERIVSMELKDAISKQSITLEIPDLSGECYKLQWEMRQFTRKYDDLLRRATGALLFVHPHRVIEPTRIDMVEPMVAELEAPIGTAVVGTIAKPVAPTGVGMPQAKESDNEEEEVRWQPEHSPTQVKIIELLQFIAGQEYFRAPFRLGVIVSAWDVVEGQKLTPLAWLRARLPMLGQFLESNQDHFKARIYGVSAQGVEYPVQTVTEHTDLEKLARAQARVDELLNKAPVERIVVIDDSGQPHHDLTEPIRWLLG